MKILYAYSDYEDRPTGRSQRLGVKCFAKARGWRVVFALVESTSRAIKAAIRREAPEGMIIESSFNDKAYPPNTFGTIPTVYFDCAAEAQGNRIFKVVYDSEAVGRRGASALLSYRKDAYAYVGFHAPSMWNARRRDGFCSVIRKAQKPLFVFDCKTPRGIASFRDALFRWCVRLPNRVGIMAANDKVAANVLDALKRCGRCVPEDAIVLGVDNDELICSNVSPSISSIRLAMSTGNRFTGNAAVVSAIKYIWENACTGIGVRDVVRMTGMSPRMAEMRFRQMTDRSIRDEIQLVRFEHVFSVLRGGIRSLSYIADCCGFGSAETFRREFRRRTGMSVRDWVQRLPG